MNVPVGCVVCKKEFMSKIGSRFKTCSDECRRVRINNLATKYYNAPKQKADEALKS